MSSVNWIEQSRMVDCVYDDGRRFEMAGLSNCRASKAATVLLTKAWAADYGPQGRGFA